MFIKLMRKDGKPIWINAQCVVTIEPGNGGGAIVVPMGDGLDYEVRESPEDVMALIRGEEIPSEKNSSIAEKSQAEPVVPAQSDAPSEEAPAVKPKRAPRKTKAKAKSVKESVPSEEDVKAAPAEETKPATKAADEKYQNLLAAGKVERLRKLSPRSVKKLANTLSAQFKVDDPDEAIHFLADSGVISIGERSAITWIL